MTQWKTVPVEPTSEMVDAAHEAFMPFGDMELALSLAIAAAPQPSAEPVAWTTRELELIDGMIEVQLHHAEQCDRIANRTMAEKQKGWDMERVALLQKIKALYTHAPDDTALLRQALEALENSHYDVGSEEKQRLGVMDAITAIRAHREAK